MLLVQLYSVIVINHVLVSNFLIFSNGTLIINGIDLKVISFGIMGVAHFKNT